MYQLPNAFFDMPGVRSAASRAVKLTVANNVSHPSVLAWSLVNEPAGSRPELGEIGPGLQTYIREAATAARQIDDTRLIAIDRQSRIGEPLWSPAYRYLDALGRERVLRLVRLGARGPARVHAPPSELGPYLDELHRANPDSPLVITEFGAEASRHGAATQRGTYEFQTGTRSPTCASTPRSAYVAGSIAWALRDFRVEPAGRAVPRSRTPRPLEQQEPDRARRTAQARLLRAAQALATHEAARLSGPLRCPP